MTRAIRIEAGDSVATLLDDADAGSMIEAGGAKVIAQTATPRGHKIALTSLAAGDPVIKYGFPIGRASRPIAPGQHVHSDNLSTGLGGTLDYRFDGPATPETIAPDPAGFYGYRRADGRVGTRNEIWILPTVGCVARTAGRIAKRVAGTLPPHIDGVHAFSHPFGCSQLGADLGATKRMLASLACHPNAAGVLIVGLGCEENQIAALLAEIPAARRSVVRTLVTQLAGDEVDEGSALVAELVAQADRTREWVGLDSLVLGVKCGGSDGLSGLTANPLVGRMSDRVARAGGSVILTEIPEIFGAEQTLMERAADAEVFDGIVDVVNGFKRYFIEHGEPVSENPSPGNVAGGITTLEEKSLGAVQKGGHATVTDVRRYGERVRRAGLTLLEAPGNDAVSCTALAAAGATLILFTTGRGTPLGFPVPTLKIASNSDLARRKPDWIDFDAGRVLDIGLDDGANELTRRLCAIAGGEETAAERNDEREIALWKRGVTL